MRVQASEPGRLQDFYATSLVTRIGVNLVSQMGINPFRVRRAATAQHAGWRQLVAIAEPR